MGLVLLLRALSRTILRTAKAQLTLALIDGPDWIVWLDNVVVTVCCRRELLEDEA